VFHAPKVNPSKRSINGTKLQNEEKFFAQRKINKLFIKLLSPIYGLFPGHIVPFLQAPGKTDSDVSAVAAKTRRVFSGGKTIFTYRSCKMKKLFRQERIVGAMLVIGLIFMGCATTGGTARFNPPDGTYYNYFQGDIVFNSADSSWEAAHLGYRGSFDYNEETSGIILTAEQELKGLRWVNIDPISDFISGRTDGKYRITLGEFKFHNPDEYDTDE
jgi:hypothetical protein